LAGLRAVVLNPAFADSLGGDPFLRGALVTGVARGSLPARIGVRPRDVIRRIDGREVMSIADLQRARSGSEVVILRGGRELTGRMPG
jgi:S1-C subfamily serine protease